MSAKQNRGVRQILFGIAALPFAMTGVDYFFNPDEKTDPATTMERVCRKEPGHRIITARLSPELDKKYRKLLERAEIKRDIDMIVVEGSGRRSPKFIRCPS